MNIKPLLPVLALALSACVGEKPDPRSPAQTQAERDVNERLEEAAGLLHDVSKKVPSSIAVQAECAVIMPAVVRGGLILGARYGRGFAVCQTDDGVSAPAPVTLSGGSAGLQVGLESVDILMVFTGDAGKKALLRGRFALGADVSVAAGPLGTGTEAKTDSGFHASVLTYSRSKGLFAGAQLSGAVLDPDEKATDALYGSPQEFSKILSGEVKTPAAAKDFVSAIEDAIAAATGR